MTIAFALFLAAFVAATLLPAQSELALAGVLLYGKIPAWLAIGSAWLGNVAGSCLNYALGRFAVAYAQGKLFPPDTIAKARSRYQKYGRWALLLSWAPIIGDPITFAAGILKEKFAVFLAIVAAAKLARYLVVAYLALKIGE